MPKLDKRNKILKKLEMKWKEKKKEEMNESLLEFLVTLERQCGHDFEFCRELYK